MREDTPDPTAKKIMIFYNWDVYRPSASVSVALSHRSDITIYKLNVQIEKKNRKKKFANRDICFKFKSQIELAMILNKILK